MSPPSRTLSIPYDQLHRSAKLALLSYEEPSAVSPWEDVEPVFLTSPPDSNEDTQAYVWRFPEETVVSFRGTSSLKDALADINVRTTKYERNHRIRLHLGFVRQFQCIEHLLAPHCVNAPNIRFVGHSLGGALAQIAALHYVDKHPDKRIICHTFGSPRVGNRCFVKHFADRVAEHYRVVLENDPVPMIPLRPIWKHVSRTCIVINDQLEVCVKLHDSPWWRRCISDVSKVDLFAPAKDHDCKEYVARLEKMKSKVDLKESVNV